MTAAPEHRDTREEVEALLSYNPETGVLTWRDANPRPYGRSKSLPGRVAGATNGQGYRQVRLLGRIYKAHRLAWLLYYGEWPPGMIDHRNGVKDDNRIVNLRLASKSQNTANRPTQRNNALGVKGVCRTASGRFRAQIKLAGVKFHLGTFDTAESAATAYAETARYFFGDFALIQEPRHDR